MSCIQREHPPHLSMRRSLLAAALITACVAPASFAQSASGTPSPPQIADEQAKTLDTVTVTAYRTTTHTQGATKTDTPIAETAQSVSVIAREELDARGASNLNDAMRYVAGVALESSGIDNRVDDFSIRGFNAGSWGGQRDPRRDAGAPGQPVEPDNVRHMEPRSGRSAEGPCSGEQRARASVPADAAVTLVNRLQGLGLSTTSEVLAGRGHGETLGASLRLYLLDLAAQNQKTEGLP